MFKILNLILIFTSLTALGQSVKIDTLKQNKNIDLTDINYPVIKTDNKKVDSIIKFDLIKQVSHNDIIDNNLISTLNQMIEDGLASLDFNVTYNSKEILSFNIDYENCGAYCYHSTQYFNYSTLTGKALSINDIISDVDKFKKLVTNKKNSQFEEQKKLLKESYEEEPGIDVKTYNWALEYYNSCDEEFELNNFSIKSDSLEIIHDCYLPNAIKNFTPVYELIYKYSEIKNYLKIN